MFLSETLQITPEHPPNAPFGPPAPAGMLPTTCLLRNLFQNRPSQKAPDTQTALSLSGVRHTPTDLERLTQDLLFSQDDSLVGMSTYPCTARLKHCCKNETLLF